MDPRSADAPGVTTMGWFRSRSRWGSYLALFALAFQLALSFGHVHLEGGAPVSGHASALLGVHAATASATAVDPADKESPALADDCCPICTLIHLAGALVPAAAPALPRLALFERVLLAAAVEFDVARPRYYSPLGARAPPLA
ncbi:MAG TPA: DUF2946 family protein [Xanthobacteraceae bacterium]|jgi:hypothetical protein